VHPHACSAFFCLVVSFVLSLLLLPVFSFWPSDFGLRLNLYVFCSFLTGRKSIHYLVWVDSRRRCWSLCTRKAVCTSGWHSLYPQVITFCRLPRTLSGPASNIPNSVRSSVPCMQLRPPLFRDPPKDRQTILLVILLRHSFLSCNFVFLSTSLFGFFRLSLALPFVSFFSRPLPHTPPTRFSPRSPVSVQLRPHSCLCLFGQSLLSKDFQVNFHIPSPFRYFSFPLFFIFVAPFSLIGWFIFILVSTPPRYWIPPRAFTHWHPALDAP